MNLCIDQGNSSTKIGIFDQNKMIESFNFDLFECADFNNLYNRFEIDACILSSVVEDNNALINEIKHRITRFVILSDQTAIPITNLYSSPETLGKDRLAAVIGANYLKPNSNILVIDAGTAITYDFINASGEFIGGNIAAGLNMRLRALNKFTSKLPLVEIEALNNSSLLGKTTENAIASGALYGLIFEIDGYIDILKIKYPELSTFLTGGSVINFHTKLKNCIFVEPNLVLIGLNRIIHYNVQK